MAPPKRVAVPTKPSKGDGEANQQMVTGTRDLAALLAIAETATQSLDTEKILNDTLDKSLEILGFDVGFIRLVELETRHMVVRVARGLHSPEFLTSVAPIDSERRNASRIVFETKEPYVSLDVRKDPHYKNRTMEREGVISSALAPIMSKKRVLGTMGVGSRRYHKFPKREISLLKAFGHQLGMAMENAQLYDEISKRKVYIENLVENAGEAIISTDLEDQILNWNRAAEVIFGYTKEEVVGKGLATLLPPDRLWELEEMRNKVQLTGVIRNLEVRRKRKDGRVIDVALGLYLRIFWISPTAF